MHLRQGRLLEIIVGILCVFCESAHGASGDTPKVIAVQSRNYHLTNEITAQVGYLPLDAFNKYVAVGGSFTHFYSDFVGWEIINLNYAGTISTGLIQDLANFGAAAEKFDTLQYYGTTNIVYTPLYTKNLLFDKSLVSGETSFVMGFGIAKFDSGNANTMDFGMLFRFLLGRYTSLKFDFRNYFYFQGDIKNNLTVIAGFSYDLGGADENPQEKKPTDE